MASTRPFVFPTLSLALCATFMAARVAVAAPAGSALVIDLGQSAGSITDAACARSAQRLASSLRQRGLHVDEEIDVSGVILRNAIDTLADAVAAAPSAPAVVYVCGMTVTLDGRLFLLPADVDLTRPSQPQTDGIVISAVLNALDGAEGLLVGDFTPTDRAATPATASALADAMTGHRHLAVVADADRDGARGQSLAAALSAPGANWPQAADVRHWAQVVAPGDVQLAMQLPPAAPPAPKPPAPKPPAPKPPAPPPAVVAPAPTPQGMPATELDRQEDPQMAAVAAANRRLLHHPSSNAQRLMSSRRMRRIQQALASLGLFNEPVTGIVDAQTYRSIRGFQFSLGKSTSGTLTSAEVAKLLNGVK